MAVKLKIVALLQDPIYGCLPCCVLFFSCFLFPFSFPFLYSPQVAEVIYCVARGSGYSGDGCSSGLWIHCSWLRLRGVFYY